MIQMETEARSAVSALEVKKGSSHQGQAFSAFLSAWPDDGPSLRAEGEHSWNLRGGVVPVFRGFRFS